MKKYVLLLLILDIVMVLLHILFGNTHPFFNLDFELNLPTYYQGIKLLIIGLLLLLTLIYKRIIFYIPLAMLLLYLGLDELLQIHESIDLLVQAWLPQTASTLETVAETVEYQSSNWVLYLIPAIIGTLAYMAGIAIYTRRLLPKLFPIICIGTLFFFAVIVLEVLNSSPGHTEFYYQLLMTTEEFSEMLGATAFAYFTYELNRGVRSPIIEV